MAFLVALLSLLVPVWVSRRSAPHLLRPLALVPIGTACLWGVGTIILVFATMRFERGVLDSAAPGWADGLVFLSGFLFLAPLAAFLGLVFLGVRAALASIRRSLPALRAQGQLPRATAALLLISGATVVLLAAASGGVSLLESGAVLVLSGIAAFVVRSLPTAA